MEDYTCYEMIGYNAGRQFINGWSDELSPNPEWSRKARRAWRRGWTRARLTLTAKNRS